MRTLKRELCLSIMLSVFLARGAAAQNPVSLRFGALQFKAQSGDSVLADSATLIVPENRSSTSSRPITVSVMRFRGTGTASEVPLIYVSGGTGAGISAAAGPRFPFFMALRVAGDVVTFDLRGGGRSRPRIACNASLSIPMAEPVTRELLVTATRESNRTCADSLRAKGFDLAGYNGREIVEDIEDIRKALGAPRVRLLGTSTGSHIALEYVRRHPDRVAALILAGVEGPGQTAHLPGGMDAAVSALDARLAETGAAGNSLTELLQSVFTSLDQKPVIVRVNDPKQGTSANVGIGGYDARVFVASTLGSSAQMKMLPTLFGAMKAGQFEMVAGLKLQSMTAPFQSPLESLHDCQAGSARDRLARVVLEAKTALLGYATLDFDEACDGWGVRELDGSFRSPVKSSVPALFISGTFDGRTPVSNAEEVMAGFPNAAHLIVDGASHGDDLFIATPAIIDAIRAFTLRPYRGTTRIRI